MLCCVALCCCAIRHIMAWYYIRVYCDCVVCVGIRYTTVLCDAVCEYFVGVCMIYIVVYDAMVLC